jgi:hypothetical protein
MMKSKTFFSAIGSPGAATLAIGNNVKHDLDLLGDPGGSGALTSSAGDLGYPDGNGVPFFSAGDGTAATS